MKSSRVFIPYLKGLQKLIGVTKSLIIIEVTKYQLLESSEKSFISKLISFTNSNNFIKLPEYWKHFKKDPLLL